MYFFVDIPSSNDGLYAWCAEDEDAAVKTASSRMEPVDYPLEAQSFNDVMAQYADAVGKVLFFKSRSDAIAALDDPSVWATHRGVAAQQALNDLLEIY